MISGVRTLLLRWNEHELFLIKLALALTGIYSLIACALDRMQIVLARGWFDTAWGLAQGAVLSAALVGGGRCVREINTLHLRVAPAAHLNACIQRFYQNLLMVCFIGLGYLEMISLMPMEAPEVVSSPWAVPAFVWLGAPLYVGAAIAWHQAWPGWIKAAIWFSALSYVAMHKAIALAWGVHQGAWLLWGMSVGGAAGLLCVKQALLKTVSASWQNGPQWWQWWRLWSQHWAERAPLLHPSLAGLAPALITQYWVRLVNHPDFPETLVSNYFWSSRTVFLTCWMFTLLRSAQSHWRWQMLPGSGFRKRLGSETAQCTARYMVMDLAIVIMFIAVLMWFWEPYALGDVIRIVQLLTWPLLVDFAWALACAVWLRSVHWRSVPDMAALLGVLWVFWRAFDPRFWGGRSWLQDSLLLCTAWLMVLRANKNFETSNWSWLKNERRTSWLNRSKRA